MKMGWPTSSLCDGVGQKGLGSPKQTGDQIILRENQGLLSVIIYFPVCNFSMLTMGKSGPMPSIRLRCLQMGASN